MECFQKISALIFLQLSLLFAVIRSTRQIKKIFVEILNILSGPIDEWRQINAGFQS